MPCSTHALMFQIRRVAALQHVSILARYVVRAVPFPPGGLSISYRSPQGSAEPAQRVGSVWGKGISAGLRAGHCLVPPPAPLRGWVGGWGLVRRQPKFCLRKIGLQFWAYVSWGSFGGSCWSCRAAPPDPLGGLLLVHGSSYFVVRQL